MILLISYDLNNPKRGYRGLYKEIKKADTWWHHLDSTWIIRTNQNPETWQDRLRRYMDKDDSLLIIEVRNNYQGWLPEEAWQWLERNLID